ncbi:hypothetical protein EC957_011064 [Mortierella hygrophila]|uniref:Uncharacterized protein n=1 Tax=Mortierella hygrophila TaxID=979708 RepID=A0A9P6F995_9FUNG|nr:hypothetical protein EC957_011064 [Mortierella hygrophila]
MGQTPADTKSIPKFITTTTTGTSNAINQDETQRRLDELKDVHNAYANLSAKQNEDRRGCPPTTPHVQQPWIRSAKIRDYRYDLNDMAAELEDKISDIRKELAITLIGVSLSLIQNQKPPATYISSTNSPAITSTKFNHGCIAAIARNFQLEIERRLEEPKHVREAFHLCHIHGS